MQRLNKNTRAFDRRNHVHGYTLLELLLSLALSVLVIGVIGFAIQLYLISLSQQQSRIERKQIARGIIQMISNDLRAGVQYKAADYGDLENLVQTQALALSAGIDELREIEANAGIVSDESSDPIPEIDTDPIIDEEAASFRPALYGSSNVIALDVSRLPRLDEYNSIVAGEDSEHQTPSDVKTLSYFYSNASTNSDGVQFTSVAPGGLYRRQLDRAVAAYSGDSGLVSSPDEYSDLVASEVAEINFRYFDGDSWLSQWDSEELQGFPPAIEVTIVIDPTRSTSGQDYLYSGYNTATMESYRTVIHLPAAELPTEEEE
ncbi:type II secretion system protein GspJ [Mariniblastus sp.]|nr:type II secretion system protein GspJ [Mariniblastus sp.]